MKRLIVGLSLLWSFSMTAAGADPWRPDEAEEAVLATLMPQPTEEMWFYMQELRRWDDPQQAVRRNAEFKAEQRRYRIEARKWLGHSASRPRASAIPQMGVHSPGWAGVTGDPYRWVGGGVLRVATVVEKETSTQ